MRRNAAFLEKLEELEAMKDGNECKRAFDVAMAAHHLDAPQAEWDEYVAETFEDKVDLPAGEAVKLVRLERRMTQYRKLAMIWVPKDPAIADIRNDLARAES
jgi:hypothetical protein